jgi:hypothetical protein
VGGQEPARSLAGAISASPSPIGRQQSDVKPASDGDGPGLHGVLLPAAQAGAQDGRPPSDPAPGTPRQPFRQDLLCDDSLMLRVPLLQLTNPLLWSPTDHCPYPRHISYIRRVLTRSNAAASLTVSGAPAAGVGTSPLPSAITVARVSPPLTSQPFQRRPASRRPVLRGRGQNGRALAESHAAAGRGVDVRHLTGRDSLDADFGVRPVQRPIAEDRGARSGCEIALDGTCLLPA